MDHFMQRSVCTSVHVRQHHCLVTSVYNDAMLVVIGGGWWCQTQCSNPIPSLYTVTMIFVFLLLDGQVGTMQVIDCCEFLFLSTVDWFTSE